MKKKRSFFQRLTGSVDESEMEIQEGPKEITPNEINWDEETPMMEDDTSFQSQDAQLTVDVYQTNDDIIIKTMVAGVAPDDLDISITRDMITIKGHRDELTDIMDDDYFYRELYWGGFSRSILLPAEIEVEEAEAIQRHGLLTVRLPKIDKDKQTKLRVKASD
jgi:HSP20 family protein